jgi:hypothetical protein
LKSEDEWEKLSLDDKLNALRRAIVDLQQSTFNNTMELVSRITRISEDIRIKGDKAERNEGHGYHSASSRLMNLGPCRRAADVTT